MFSGIRARSNRATLPRTTLAGKECSKVRSIQRPPFRDPPEKSLFGTFPARPEFGADEFTQNPIFADSQGEHQRCAVIPAQAIGLVGGNQHRFPELQARFMCSSDTSTRKRVITESAAFQQEYREFLKRYGVASFGVDSMDRAFSPRIGSEP
jgi:hypothetical protein